MKDVAAAGLDDIVAGTEVFDFFPVSPTLSLPLMMAMVAGVAPLSRTICSTARAVSTFFG